ncbi:hypothetical protein MASR1M107_00060 [Ignavibacteriales bacterium]
MKYLIFILSVVTFSSVAQNVLVVDQAGGGNYLTITAAIAAANNGDTIKVLPATYTDAFSISKSVHLRAIDTNCIIQLPSGSGIGSSSANGSIVGFKIKANSGFSGNNFIVVGNVFEQVTITGGGGSNDLTFSQNVMRGCTINLPMTTGNAYFADNDLYSCTMTTSHSARELMVVNNKFNSSQINASCSSTGKTVIHNNIFTQTVNTVTSASIGSSSTRKIVFSDNTITGGNVGVSSGSNTVIIGNVIQLANNGVTTGSLFKVYILANKIRQNLQNGIYCDIFSQQYSPSSCDSLFILNNEISQNTSYGLYIRGASSSSYITFKSAWVLNNVFSGNSYGFVTDRAFNGGAIIRVMNNVFISNTTGVLSIGASYSITDYNCAFANGNNTITGLGNITANPLFVNTAGGDFHLSSGSPCIDAGNPATTDFDLDRTRNDMGIYGGSFNWDNFNGSSANAKVFELALVPLNTVQGNTITINGGGMATKANPTENTTGQQKNEAVK